MIALLQRVSRAHVAVAGAVIGEIERGVLALIGVQRADEDAQVERLLTRVLGYRIFPDAEGRMNLSLTDVSGGLLLVPQFTLAADTRTGTRPGFSTAAAPERAQALFEVLVQRARERHAPVAVGRFGAHMEVALVNDGPVTLWLEASGT
ncbi:MAG TPA: D-aminoacyl-tRNA deacylase [Steroidobacteraceae bacterium]|nr:D-aminoacyl-tRNA deacylase [Steroidobacteraceae bacterium]